MYDEVKEDDEIASGEYGIVYKIRRNDEKVFAMKKFKIPKGDKAKLYIEKAKKEVDLMSKIDHPFLVKAEDYMIKENIIKIIMEYFPKSSLWNYLEENNHVSQEFIKRIFLCCVDGLYYLKKEHGMNHRDIKPQNILLTEEFVPKLSDFCSIKSDLSQQAYPGLSGTIGMDLQGTITFLAPEVIVSYDEYKDKGSA